MSDYDVVIIGAGNSGLTAALTLVNAGLRTLLIEQRNTPGGCASTFKRGRFEFDISLHQLSGVGPLENPGETRTLFENFGLNINWVPIKDCFRLVSNYSDGEKMDVTMPSGKDAFLKKMEKYVPGSYKKMDILFELIDEVVSGVGNMSSPTFKNDYPNLIRTGAYSVTKVFDAIGLPMRCQDILSSYWSYLGVDLSHMSFIHYANMINSYICRGPYTVKYTCQELSLALLEEYRRKGGDVWLGCKANKLVFNNNLLTGVETTLGSVSCDYVLADINPEVVLGSMIPPELVPQRDKQLASARKKSYSGRMFSVYLGLDCTAEELGIKDYMTFLSDSANSGIEYETIMNGMDTNNYCFFVCYNIANPNASPNGTCICSLSTMCAPSDWEKITQENYCDFKTQMAKWLIGNLRNKTGIDLLPHVEEIAVATPWTFARYLSSPEGSTFGYEMKDWDSLAPRMMTMNDDYTIKGLHFIGASSVRGTGYSSTYQCGKMYANIVLKEILNNGGTK